MIGQQGNFFLTVCSYAFQNDLGCLDHDVHASDPLASLEVIGFVGSPPHWAHSHSVAGLLNEQDLLVDSTQLPVNNVDVISPIHASLSGPTGNLVDVDTSAHATFPLTTLDYPIVDYQAHDAYEEHSNGNLLNDASAFNDTSAFMRYPYRISSGNAVPFQSKFGPSSAHMTSQTAYQPIAPAAASNATNTPTVIGPATGVNQAGFPCPFPGCTRTFRRIGDCRRHEAKHQPSAYKCMVFECKKKFYRLDKARDHLRQGHGITL
jgi:hypothetical protein